MNRSWIVALVVLAPTWNAALWAWENRPREREIDARKPHAGTYIHVLNSTNRTLSFQLYVECAEEGTGKFDDHRTLEPGQVAVWRLGAAHRVATVSRNGRYLYRVGLVGKDQQTGKRYQWGVVGSDGMLGKEKMSETETDCYRNIVVQPVGDL